MRAILIPVNLDDEIREVEGPDYRSIWQAAGIEYGERVNTAQTGEFNFVATVDEDGYAKGMPFNPRACLVVNYSGPLVGPVVLFSERMTSDGMSFTDVSPEAVTLIHELRDRIQEKAQQLKNRLG